MAEFCFTATQAVVEETILNYCMHPDFQDIVQEAVVATWRATRRRQDISIKTMARRQAVWQLKEWLRDGKSGDLVSSHLKQERVHISVQQAPERADEWLFGSPEMTREQQEARLVWQDFFLWAEGRVQPHYLKALKMMCEGYPRVLAAQAVGIAANSLNKGLALAFRRYRERDDANGKCVDRRRLRSYRRQRPPLPDRGRDRR